MLLSSSAKGNYAELLVASVAASKGYHVGFMPQQCPYDLVIDRGNGPERVQVKYKSVKKSGVVNIQMDMSFSKNNNTVYSKENIDFYVIVESTNQQIAWIPIEFLETRNSLTLRVEQPKTNNKNITMFSNFNKW